MFFGTVVFEKTVVKVGTEHRLGANDDINSDVNQQTTYASK